MFDTLAVAQQLAAGGVARDQAEVIAKAIHDGLEQGNHVNSDQFKAGLAEVRNEIANLDTRLSRQIAGVRTEIANLETRLIRWMVGTVIATATLTVGILRFLRVGAGDFQGECGAMSHERLVVILLAALIVSAAVLVPSTAHQFRGDGAHCCAG